MYPYYWFRVSFCVCALLQPCLIVSSGMRGIATNSIPHGVCTSPIRSEPPLAHLLVYQLYPVIFMLPGSLIHHSRVPLDSLLPFSCYPIWYLILDKLKKHCCYNTLVFTVSFFLLSFVSSVHVHANIGALPTCT